MIVAKSVARVLPDAMEVAAENGVPVLRDKASVVPKDKVVSEVRVVMVRVKVVQVSAEEDLGAMNAARYPNAAKHRYRCLKSTPQSFPMKRAWSPWRVR